jgi:hypothetical protein
MRFVMNPDMVYQYPIWAVGLLLVGAAVLGAVLPRSSIKTDLARGSFISTSAISTWHRKRSLTFEPALVVFRRDDYGRAWTGRVAPH